MDLTGLWPFLIVAFSILGLFVGGWAKKKSQMIVPFNDPLSMALFILIMFIFAAPSVCPEYAYIDPYDLNQAACIIGFSVTYIYGYAKGELLYVYVSAHDVWRLKQDIRPIAYYWNSQNQLCWQPQSFVWVMKRILFNIDCPMDFDVGSITRRREVIFKGKYVKLNAYVVDTAKMTITPKYVKKWILRHKVLECHFDPSPLNTYDEYDFYLNGSIADEYVRNYQTLKLNNLNGLAGMRKAEIIGSVDLVSALASMTPDAELMEMINKDIKARNVTDDDIEEAREATGEDKESLFRMKGKARQTKGGYSDGE